MRALIAIPKAVLVILLLAGGCLVLVQWETGGLPTSSQPVAPTRPAATAPTVTAAEGQPTQAQAPSGFSCPNGRSATKEEIEQAIASYAPMGLDPAEQWCFDHCEEAVSASTQTSEQPPAAPAAPLESDGLESIPWWVWIIVVILAFVIATIIAFKFIFK